MRARAGGGTGHYLDETRLCQAPTPLGTLGIVPQAPLPPLVIPQPQGLAPSIWQMPNSPALVGVSLHAQALWLSSLGSARLSNTVTDTGVR